jgi:hypothetical protein
MKIDMALIHKVIADSNSGPVSKSEMIRRRRLANLRKLLRDRNGPILPDDDAGREYLVELLLPISVGPHPDLKMPHTIEVWAPWMRQNEAVELIDRINQMPIWERKPNAKVLGERLNLSNPDRERLKLWTIAPCDMGDEGMAWWRKHKKRERARRLRRSRGQLTRADYLASHRTAKEQPWTALGVSRRTYYYRLRAGDCTSPCQVKLNNRSHQVVQSEKRPVSKKKGAVRANSIKQVISQIPQSQKAEIPMAETARVVLTPTSAITEQTVTATKPVWCTPNITELPWSDYWDAVYKSACDKQQAA